MRIWNEIFYLKTNNVSVLPIIIDDAITNNKVQG